MQRQRLLLTLTLLTLLAIPAAADDIIYSGSDLWVTPATGRTFADFSYEPIPAGFFCNKSASFTGQIPFKGVPVSADLGRTDTIVERLDDAALNDKGIASTRIQIRALSLESIAPVKTACGSYLVKVSLHGNQPVTRMRIVQDHDNGGRFIAPLSLNVKMTFVPVVGNGRELELVRRIRFSAAKHAVWLFRTPELGFQKAGFIKVDTDGDRQEDAFVLGTSNFAAGLRAFPNKSYDQCAAWVVFHDDPRHGHELCGY